MNNKLNQKNRKYYTLSSLESRNFREKTPNTVPSFIKRGFLFLFVFLMIFMTTSFSLGDNVNANVTVILPYDVLSINGGTIYSDQYNQYYSIVDITGGLGNFIYTIPFIDVNSDVNTMDVFDKNNNPITFDYSIGNINFSADYSLSNYKIYYEAKDFTEINYTLSYITQNYDKYTYIGVMNISSNNNQGLVMLYSFNKSRLIKFSQEIPSLRKVYVDDISTGITYADGGINANISISASRSSSINSGLHNFKLVYYVTATSGGSPPLPPEEEEEPTPQDELTESILNEQISLFLDEFGLDFTLEDLEDLKQMLLDEFGIEITLDELNSRIGNLNPIEPDILGVGGGGGAGADTDPLCNIEVSKRLILDADHLATELIIRNKETESILPTFAIYPSENKESAIGKFQMRGSVQEILPQGTERIVITTNSGTIERLDRNEYATILTRFEGCRDMETEVILRSGALLVWFDPQESISENFKNFVQYFGEVLQSELVNIGGISIPYWVLALLIFIMLFAFLVPTKTSFIQKILFSLAVTIVIIFVLATALGL